MYLLFSGCAPANRLRSVCQRQSVDWRPENPAELAARGSRPLPLHTGHKDLLWAATDSQLLTPNAPNTAGGDLRKRALEFYAKAKAIRHNKSMGAAAQPTQSA
jgi:hypothetical protein